MISRRTSLAWLLLIEWLMVTSWSQGQTPPPPATPTPATSTANEATPPKTVVVKEDAIQIDVSLQGILVPTRSHEIRVEPEKWTQLEVLEVVSHGARVSKGDTLIRFDTRKLDEQIADQEIKLALAELELKGNEAELALAAERLPLDNERSEITKSRADEDFQRYQEIDHPFALRAAEFYLKGAEHGLEYSAEELKQLEQMYKADDLTEETEEIVLKRARNDFERAGFYFEQSKKDFAESTKVSLPREAQERATAHHLADLEHRRAMLSLPLDLRRRESAQAKMKLEVQRSSQDLASLREDRKQLEIKSPADGTIYYGRMTDGKWPPVAETMRRLRRHGNVDPHDVLLTVVDNSALVVVANVPEADVQKVPQGLAGKLTPTSDPKSRIAVTMGPRSDIPMSEGSYRAELTMDNPPGSKLVAGMTGTVKLVSYSNPKAVVVPAKSVFPDARDDTRHFVYVLVPGENKVSERRDCVVGVTSGDWTEILSGLKPGDSILEEKPAAK